MSLSGRAILETRCSRRISIPTENTTALYNSLVCLVHPCSTLNLGFPRESIEVWQSTAQPVTAWQKYGVAQRNGEASSMIVGDIYITRSLARFRPDRLLRRVYWKFDRTISV